MAAAPLLFIFLVLNLNLNPFGSQAQSLVQPKFDGFVYGGRTSDFNPDAILIEAFFDPVCPDTRDTWPPLKQALEFYGSRRVSLIVHTFPLPYHDNSFITSRTLHVVDGLNSSATYPLLELFFREQEKFYNLYTSNTTKIDTVNRIIDLVADTVGQKYYSAIKSGFSDQLTDLKTRFAFKYGCSRGVYGTPTFILNGVVLPDAGSPVDYAGWKKLIDPLVGSKKAQ
ncbi:hypothetical protein AKJ16_DCAP04374 [Drosera capensis]